MYPIKVIYFIRGINQYSIITDRNMSICIIPYIPCIHCNEYYYCSQIKSYNVSI